MIIQPDTNTNIDNSTGLYYKVIDNEITIIGSNENMQIINIPSIIAGNPVTTIESGAFENRIDIKNVTFPNTIKRIGESAFSGCTELKEIDFPNTNFSIEGLAFEGCISLKEIIIPTDTVWHGIFYNCTGLEKVTFTDNVKSISGNEIFFIVTT